MKTLEIIEKLESIKAKQETVIKILDDMIEEEKNKQKKREEEFKPFFYNFRGKEEGLNCAKILEEHGFLWWDRYDSGGYKTDSVLMVDTNSSFFFYSYETEDEIGYTNFLLFMDRIKEIEKNR